MRNTDLYSCLIRCLSKLSRHTSDNTNLKTYEPLLIESCYETSYTETVSSLIQYKCKFYCKDLFPDLTNTSFRGDANFLSVASYLKSSILGGIVFLTLQTKRQSKVKLGGRVDNGSGSPSHATRNIKVAYLLEVIEDQCEPVISKI